MGGVCLYEHVNCVYCEGSVPLIQSLCTNLGVFRKTGCVLWATGNVHVCMYVGIYVCMYRNVCFPCE